MTQADVAVFELLPPLHYSSVQQGDIILDTRTVVFDNVTVDGIEEVDISAEFQLFVTIEVDGIADKPPTRSINITANEDDEYFLGAELAAQLPGVLIDVSI